MPIMHFVDRDLGILMVIRSGSVTLHEEWASFRARAEDPEVVPGIPVLVDCREVEPADSTEVIREVAAHATRHASDLKCGRLALLVRGDVEYGMARMYQALTDLAHPETRVFRRRHRAVDWLLARVQERKQRKQA